MSFKDLSIKYYYNNDESDFVNDFYKPLLSEAVLYKRLSGFFSSSSFWNIIDGLKVFLKNEGKIKLLISPNLSDEDINAIIYAKVAKEKIIDKFIIENILNENKYVYQFNFLSWLIYENKLEIKIVIKKDNNLNGIFHDKSAILYDYEENKIAFHGSLNESNTGYKENFESINVFKGWNEPDSIRIDRIEKTFDMIWNNNSDKWYSYFIPESIKLKIIEKKSVDKPQINNRINKNKFCIPEKVILREYQNKAVEKWFNNKCKGVLEMATGSGKTLTAIFALNKFYSMLTKRGYPCGIVIVVPYKNLLEQWCKELDVFGVNPIKCYENKNKWYMNLKLVINDFNKGRKMDLFVITTNTTFISDYFQENLCNIKRDYVFCADEMHHLMAPKISKLLPQNTEYRLGLTATLCNEFDKENSKNLVSYFDKTVFTFSLEDAIKNKCLTKYYYYPIIVSLDDVERKEYYELTKKISRFINKDNDINNEVFKALVNKRRRIILNANNKLIKFSQMKEELNKYNKVLVYCGDKIDEEGKYVDRINKIIYDMGINTHTYTAELNATERNNILERFKNGDLKVLTAIRCLDEGVDIPALDCAFILSSNMDSKQFIQRRGRILRKCTNKEFAYIYDFVVVPSLNKNEIEQLSNYELRIEKKIIMNEFKRIFEFASLSENKIDAISKITDILELYN